MSKSYAVFAADVLALYAEPMRRKATLAKMRQVLDEFGALCEDVGDLSPATVARWLAAHPGRRRGTVVSLLTSLRAACRYAVRMGWLAASPFDWRGPAAWAGEDDDWRDPPVHTSAEVAAALALADLEAAGGDWRALRLRAVAYVLAYTGARKREVLGLEAADVDLAAGTISIHPNAARRLKTAGSRAGADPAPIAGRARGLAAAVRVGVAVPGRPPPRALARGPDRRQGARRAEGAGPARRGAGADVPEPPAHVRVARRGLGDRRTRFTTDS